MRRAVPQKQFGVTLVEALIALTIMAGVATSILLLVGQNTQFAVSIRERTFAGIAADNIMAEFLALETREVEVNQTTEAVRFMEWDWNSTVTVTDTGAANLFRVDVTISDPQSSQTIGRATTLWTAP